jgi:NAD-dependent SIR2 family protein deacetylase
VSVVDVAQVARLLARAKRVVFLTGAGLSVASGIAPYRKSKDAVWANFVTEWGTIRRFRDDPAAWWREFWIKAHGEPLHDKHPNAGHDAITALLALLAAHGHDAVVITQNIDGLHRKAGVPEAQLVEIHGRHDRFICSDATCEGARVPVDAVDLSGLPTGVVPRCARCRAPLRPLVLLFDEMYDSHAAYRMREARRALNDAEAIVFVGTSFSVGITDYAVRAGGVGGAVLVNINPDAVEDHGFWNLCGNAEVVLPDLLLHVRAGLPAG